MTSKEVVQFIKDDKVSQLYTKFKKCFDIIDNWSDTCIEGDLLDENQLATIIDQNTGIHAKLIPIVNAFESYLARIENNGEDAFYKAILDKKEKVNAQAVSMAKAESRSNASDVREWLGDFKAYLEGAKQNICSAQSRLKRLVVDKGAKKVGYTGEAPIEEPEVQEETTVQKPDDKPWGEQ